MVIALTILLGSLAILVATGPLIYAIHHSMRYGHVASLPDHAPTQLQEDPSDFGWSVCSQCQSVVVDVDDHVAAVHQLTTV